MLILSIRFSQLSANLDREKNGWHVGLQEPDYASCICREKAT
jgi:hypothetical protein